MKKKILSHIDDKGHASMVDVSEKIPTRRVARAQAIVNPGKEVLDLLLGDEIITRKGPVFHTARLAGVMAAKQTSSLIPLCHPIGLDDCQVNIQVKNKRIVIDAHAVVTSRTGVEMEALTAASIAALTVYDMCKAITHRMVIEKIRLMEKTGGKRDFKRKDL
jgi:cyclic pyranopterin phosphate synthase